MSKKKSEENLGTVTKNRAIKIFESLGFKTANGWDTVRLQKKLVKLSTLVEGAELDKKTQKRVNEILRAQKAGRKVVVVDPEDAVADKKRGKAVKDAAKREVTRKVEKKSKTAKKEKADVKKKAKKTKAAKKQEKRIAEKTKTVKAKSGIMSLIVEMLRDGPTSKKAMVAKLLRKFPDKKEQTVRNTVSWQICDLRKRGSDVREKDSKYQLHGK